MTSLDAGVSLVDHAIRAVRSHIRTQDLKVGDPLPAEGSFAAELGVSRAVIREAFGALAALRLIDVGNGRNARVGAIDGSVIGTSIDHAVSTSQISPSDVWDVRRTLELRTVELAAQARSASDAQAILQHAADMAKCGDDLDALTRHDIAFHQAIARACRNELFVQIVRSFEPLMRLAVPLAWNTRETWEQRHGMLELHRKLAEAIHDGAASKAVSLMNDHFDRSIGSMFNR